MGQFFAHPLALGESLRHLAMARIMAKEGVLAPGGWGDVLYHGYFTQHNSDPWFLWHVLLMPLANLPPFVAQAVISSIFLCAFAALFTYLCRMFGLSKQVSILVLFGLFFLSTQFLLRIFLARPVHLQVLLTLIAILASLRGWKLGLFATMAVSTLVSHLFVFPMLLAGAVCLWRNRLLLVFCAAGIGVGLWLHPHSVEYIHYLLTVFTKLPFLMQLDIATEMESGLGRDAPVLFMLAICLVLAAHLQKDRLWNSALPPLLAAAFVMTLGLYRWVRMIDFLWPFLIFIFVYVISLEPYLERKIKNIIFVQLNRKALVAVLVLFTVIHVGKLWQTYVFTAETRSLHHVAEALAPLPSGVNVLNIDWDMFPSLMYVRPDLHYARGMDPGFNYVVDAGTARLFYPGNTNRNAAWLQQLLAAFPQTEAVAYWTIRQPELKSLFQSTPLLKPVYPDSKISVFLLQ